MPSIINPDPVQAKLWTWGGINQMCQKAKASGRPGIFTWQGDISEGLVCNFVEVLSGYGGQIFDDPVQPTKVTINSPEASEALQQMVDWIYKYKISPTAVLSDEEESSQGLWTLGKAAFMRNWPGVITASSDAHAATADKFQVVALPSHSQSCLGGWNLTINSFSPNKDAAWKFIYWLLREDAQQYLALRESLPVTLKSVYTTNQYVKQQMPFYPLLEGIIEDAQFRPMSPHYQTCISGAIQQCVHQALANPSCYTPEMALADLERELNRILQLNPSDDCSPSANIITGCPIVQ